MQNKKVIIVSTPLPMETNESMEHNQPISPDMFGQVDVEPIDSPNGKRTTTAFSNNDENVWDDLY